MPNPLDDADRLRVPSPAPIDLFAGRTRTGRVPNNGPGYGPFTTPTGEPINPPFIGGVPRQMPVIGSVITFPLIIGTEDTVILLRPSSAPRIFLFLQNVDAGNNVFVSFDIPATTAGGGSVPFGPGATFNFMDFVPQNEIHAIASGAGTLFLLIYCNADFPI